MSAAILAFPTAVPATGADGYCMAANGYIVGIGDDLELPAARLRIHHYRGSIRVTDCAGAGKRGARCVEVSAETDLYHAGDQREAAYYWLAALPLVADIDEAIRWAAALGVKLHHATLRGVDVAPLNLEPLVIRGPHVVVSVDHRTASASDLADRWNDPAALTRNPSAATAKKARAIIEANRAAIESGALRFYDVVGLLRDAGFSMHTWCRND